MLSTWSRERRNRFLLVIGLLLLVVFALWAARGALFPYIFALVLAYLLLPFVNLLDAELHRVSKGFRYSRPIAILIVYLLGTGLIVLFFNMVVPIVVRQFTSLWDNRAALAAELEEFADQGLVWYRENVPQDVQAEVEATLGRAGQTIADALQAGVSGTFTVVTETISFMLAIAVIPFFLFYVLNDEREAATAFVRLIPRAYRIDVLNMLRIIDGILSAYIRGQLLLGVVIALMSWIGLSLLGVQFALLLGLIAGAFELIPFIGPILGAIPAVTVALIQEPIVGLWTLLLFLGIQQAENVLLVPRISGEAVKLHPAIIMVVLVIGNQIAGLLGMLIAVPLTAVIRDVFKYLYLRFQDAPVTPADAMERLGRVPIQLDV